MTTVANVSSHCIEVVFDVRNQTLEVGAAEQHLSPKAAAVLTYLCSRPRQLSTKDELLESVWSGMYVVDAVLKNVVMELRQCLGDDARSPRFIETVHRRGYRFIGEHLIQIIGTGRSSYSVAQNTYEDENRVFAGRESELHALSEEWALAQSGRCKGIVISGDPGIGKTSLVSHWLAAQASKSRHHAIAQINCATSANQPPCATMLDIIATLSEKFDNEQFAKLLAHYAPTWLRSMPWLCPSLDTSLKNQSGAPSILHPSNVEATIFLEALSDVRPLIIVIEDLHRCDSETVQLLNNLFVRKSRCRLLIVATRCCWRASESQADRMTVSHGELLINSWRCIELAPLGDVSLHHAMEDYMGDEKLNDETARWIQQRSDGHPLFLSGMMTHIKLVGSNVLLPPDGPDVFRQRMAGEFRTLHMDEQKILKAASIVTIKSFSAAAVAHLLSIDLLEMEAQLDHLADREQWLTRLEGRLWPDGTRAQSYGFRLKPYRDFVYATLPAATRQQLHLRHAHRLELAYADELHLICENLAYHFRQGGSGKRASHYGKLLRLQSPHTDRVARMQLAPCFHPPIPILGESFTVVAVQDTFKRYVHDGNAGYPATLAQIPTYATNAPGSCVEF